MFQAIGLGYGQASEGLMERRPRKPDEPILTRGTTRWFAIAGLVMAASTLAVIAGAEHEENAELARTMGLTTFAIANLVFSYTARDELRSLFSLETFNDRTFLITSLMSAAAIILATESQFLHRILDTVELTGNQWLDLHRRGRVDRGGLRSASSCSGAVASEIRKLLLRRARASEELRPVMANASAVAD